MVIFRFAIFIPSLRFSAKMSCILVVFLFKDGHSNIFNKIKTTKAVELPQTRYYN